MSQPKDSTFTCIIDHLIYAQNASNFPETSCILGSGLNPGYKANFINERVTLGEWMSAQGNATMRCPPALQLFHVCLGWSLASSVSPQLWPFQQRNGAEKPLMPMRNASCLALVAPREGWSGCKLWSKATHITWPTAPAMQGSGTH